MKKSTILFILSFSLFAAEGNRPYLEQALDLRYRHEWNHLEGNALPSYHQQRLMFRYGGKLVFHEDADIQFRLATSTGRTSTNQTLTGGFANFSIGLDRAFFNIRPLSSLNVYGGRVKNTFYSAKGSDLVWDGDLNFDGLAGGYLRKGTLVNLWVNSGFFWLNKSTTDNLDNHLIAGQIGAEFNFTEFKINTGVALYHYTNMNTQTAIDSGNFKGNSSNGTGASATYANHYSIINPGMDLVFDLFGNSSSISADFVSNLAASSDNFGYLFGFSYGEGKKEGEWKFSYDYRKLEKDAVVAAFTDGDSFSGGTDGQGHRFKLSYRAIDTILVGASIFLGSKNISSGATSLARDKFQLDLQFSI